MSVIPSGLQAALFRENRRVLHFIFAAWSFATGLVMVLNWRVLSHETVWQPAMFGSPTTLIGYGAVFLTCAPMYVLSSSRHKWWWVGVIAGAVTGFLSLFLAITFSIEAYRSGQGWLGAINNTFVAVIVGLLIRVKVREFTSRGQ